MAGLLGAVAVVFLLGLARLTETFNGDQALFVVYAKGIISGQQLYTDLWDVKQPGIFYFYAIAGQIFGFSEIGVHFFELLYWIIFSAALIWIANDQFKNESLRYLLPLATAGYYYLTAGSLQMTQVETLVGFPLLFSFALIPKYCKSVGSAQWIFGCLISGLAVALALLLKFAFLPLLGLLTLTAVSLTVRNSRKPTYAAAGVSLFFIWTIAAAFLGLFLLNYWYDGILDEIIYSTFRYPREALAAHAGADRLPTLVNSLVWFLLTFAPLIILSSIFGLLAAIRHFRNSSIGHVDGTTHRDLSVSAIYAWCYLVWLAVGLFVLGMQATSWWSYHFMLFFVPLGFFALRGVDKMIMLIDEYMPAFSRGAIASFVAASIVVLAVFNIFTVRVVKSRLKPRNYGYQNGLAGPTGDSWEIYQKVTEESRKAGLPSGGSDIWACAEPHYYYHNDKIPPISSNGWMPEFFVEGQWSRLEREVLASKPKYLILNSFCVDLIRNKAPGFQVLLDSEYKTVFEGENVSWYRSTVK